jgi:PAS domain S-box-containing protein
MPLQRKLTLIILLTSGVVTSLACAGLFIFQFANFRKDYIRDLEALAKMFADNSTAAVTFNDRKSAEETLGALRAKPRIVSAEIRLPGGAQFARYGADETGLNPEAAEPRNGGSYWFWHENLIMPERIELDGKRIGTLYLWSDYGSDYRALLRLDTGILLAVGVFSILLSYLLSNRLQQLISGPILKLADTAQKVAENNDYSVRAEPAGRDEVGLLTEAFNHMLGQIEAQDGALRSSQQQFASLVNSITGIVWEADPATLKLQFVSPQVEAILGYPLDHWLEQENFWQEHRHPDDRNRIAAFMRQCIMAGKPFQLEYRMLHLSGRVLWFQDNINILMREGRPVLLRGVTLDITAEKLAREKLAEAQQELVATSRLAGMAEVATGVLHNVGNVLNSINVSTTHAREMLRGSEMSSLVKIGALLGERGGDLGAFLTTDPKGKLVPGFLIQLARQLKQEHAMLEEEHEQLAKNVEHIKEIVAMQQDYARVSGFIEKISLSALVDDALLMNTAGLGRHGVQLIREYAEVPLLQADKHKVLQILVNLVHNAKYALDMSASNDRQLKVAIGMNGDNRVKVVVTDNGIGIAPENLTRIFSHGFTTRKNGHGFGLHSGAIAAKEMGGSLKAESAGPGKGATFTLELPLVDERTRS